MRIYGFSYEIILFCYLFSHFMLMGHLNSQKTMYNISYTKVLSFRKLNLKIRRISTLGHFCSKKVQKSLQLGFEIFSLLDSKKIHYKLLGRTKIYQK